MLRVTISPEVAETLRKIDAIKARSAQRRGEDPHEAVEKMVERVRSYERRTQERIAEYDRTRPYRCGHERCTDRFKSAGARTRHERHDCRYFKYDREGDGGAG
jgi:hypothetical protein